MSAEKGRIIRSYRPPDRSAVVALIIELFDHLHASSGKDPWMSTEQAQEFLDEWLEGGPIFVLEEDGVVAALARLREDHGVYWVEDLVVQRDKRRQGLGSQLLLWVEHWVQERGAEALFLDIVPSNLASLDFYLENGYCYLNTVELRKNFYETEPKKTISFLGRRLQLHSWPVDRPLPG